ncbi:MAG: hypothetical protein R2795_00085 [Saprospiraceae bacterium]
MRITATTFALLCMALWVSAQKEVFLTANPAIATATNGFDLSQLAVEKEDCGTTTLDVVAVIANERTRIRLRQDTIGFTAEGYYECVNCDQLVFGNAYVPVDANGSPVDSLGYEALPTAIATVEEVQIRYCNPAGTACGELETYRFLARRRGLNLFPPVIQLAQAETISLSADNVLPGQMTCSFFVDCFDNYAGRDQLAWLDDYNAPTNGFTYQSGRFAGVDSLCLVICDDYGICDTTHYAFRVDVPTIQPPFYDDFSYEGVLPSPELWLDQEVYVNTRMASDPPSLECSYF